MSASFSLTMHPASEGDCTTLAWSDGGVRGRALVDLGRTKDYRALLPELRATKAYDLFVMTHVDADHIEGAMPLVREARPSFDAGQVWFNAYHHLIEARDRARQDYEMFGAKQGEKLSEGIIRFGWRDRWNAAFDHGAVSVDAAAAKAPIDICGLSVTLLSPDDQRLAALEPKWLAELRKVGLLPLDPDKVEADADGNEQFGALDVEKLAAAPFTEDTASPNGSSIAFLAEFGGKRVVMAADAHPGAMADTLRRLGATEDAPMAIDLFKVSHHGSKANTSPELLALVDCRRYAFSTDGTRHDHPDAETIARILKQEERRRAKRPEQALTEIIFNFRQPHTVCWDVERLKSRYHYACTLPPEGRAGISVEI